MGPFEWDGKPITTYDDTVFDRPTEIPEDEPGMPVQESDDTGIPSNRRSER